MQKIPTMQEIDLKTGEVFTLSESHTIMRYLANTRGIPDHWYPADPRQRAQVDMYLDQHHSFLRVGLTQSILELGLPRITGKPHNKQSFKKSRAILEKTLAYLELKLTANPFICGTEKTLADLSAACELDQGKWVAHDLSKYPKVKEWLERMIDHDQVNVVVACSMLKCAKKTNDWLQKQQGYPKL